MSEYILWLHEVEMSDVDRVGGKNASLGEMLRNLTADGSVKVPGGFATTAHAYREFLAHEGLADRINKTLDELDVDDVGKLVATGRQIRQWVMDTPFPPALDAAIDAGLWQSGKRLRYRGDLGRALLGDGRGPARCLLSPVSRRRCSTCSGLTRHQAAHSRGVRVSVQRPGDLLPGAPGLRSLAGRAVCRHPEDGPLRYRRQRRAVHAGYREWFSRRRVHHSQLRAR